MKNWGSVILSVVVSIIVSNYIPWFRIIRDSLIAQGDTPAHAQLIYDIYFGVAVITITGVILLLMTAAQKIISKQNE